MFGTCCFSSVVAVAMFLVSLSFVSHVESSKCIKGMYHKNQPSLESSEYKQCHSYKDSTCCTARFTADLAENRTKNLYNHTWDHCGLLSAKCLSFWIKQECFYQCSPHVFAWEDPQFAGGIKGVPVCNGFCDDWFEACKDEKICVENVLADFDYGEFGHNHCPKVNNKVQCKTYKDRYINGKGLCEKMWGPSYVYTLENAKRSNCFQMDFSGQNPNGRVPQKSRNPKSGSSVNSASICVVLMLGIFSIWYV